MASTKITINNSNPRVRCIKESGLYPAFNALIEHNEKENNTIVDLQKLVELTDKQFQTLLDNLLIIKNNK